MIKAIVMWLAVASSARAHGTLENPRARNVIRNTDYCPHCLNNGGAWETFGGGKDRRTPCGDPPGSARFLRDGDQGFAGFAQTLAPGDAMPVRVELTTNHLGKMTFALCPSARESTECFDSHVLKTIGVPDGVLSFESSVIIPRNVEAGPHTLRWQYWTANSCTYRDLAREYTNPNVPVCFENGAVPEIFTNCADVQIAPIAESSPTTTLKPCLFGDKWFRPGRGKRCIKKARP